MAISKFLDPKNDFAFKRIFGTERNKDILIEFLNDILDFKTPTKITEVTFLKTTQDPETRAKKQSIVDVLCTDQHGGRYIIEMQVARTEGFVKRAQYYAAKTYVNQMNVGDSYDKLKEVIFVAISNFVMFPDNNRYKSDHVILDKESHEHQLKDFSFTFLELPKFHKELSDSKTMTEKWMYFFKHADEMSEADLEKLVGTNVVLRHAYEELDKFSWSEEELMFYEEALKSQLDYQAMLDSAKNEGREEGIQQGIEQGREEGIELGIERGIERGIEQEREEGRQAQCRLLTNLLRTKFKEIPESHFQSIETADVSQLETWILRLMTAHSMEDVFHE